MRIGRIIAFGALLMAGLVGLAMTVCGGGFLLMFLRAPRGGTDPWSGLAFFAVITLGSIAIGSTILVAVFSGMKALSKKDGG